jgi:hypothetical protein
MLAAQIDGSGAAKAIKELINEEETFKPKLNKNTDKFLESRQRRLLEK